MRTTAQILREYRGPALFSFGFRPFFLLASLWGMVAVPIWVALYLGLGGEGLTHALDRDWHVHEMLFGYTGAVVVGYMIVAGANWTGRYPVAGWPVVRLVALWLAGRMAMMAWPTLGMAADVIDAAFLSVFAAILWREQLAASNWRSLAPCMVITLLALADIAFHLGRYWVVLGPYAERAATALIAFLIALMGGRLVPSFTRNWMARHKIRPEPAPQSLFDRVTLALTALGLLAWVLAPDLRAGGVLALAGGVGLALRMLRWRGWVAASEGMVLILHLGYAWLGLGIAALGAAMLWPMLLPVSAAVHALTAGGIGVMTLAMMTRTARSHTGRERRADAVTWLLYASINLAALLRVAAPLWSEAYGPLLVLSAIGWSAAFLIFACVYGPMLARPMVKRKKEPRPAPAPASATTSAPQSRQ